MSVSLFFGLPGCGKTTILTALAYKHSDLKKYNNIYCNIHLSIPNVTYIDNDVIGKYLLRDCLILIDEATLFADNRGYKEFSKELTSFFLEHRHFNCDIVLFCQQWDGVDKKIRVITDRVYYVYKGKILGHWFTKSVRIPYGIDFPNPRHSIEGRRYGDIVQGYAKPPLILRITAHIIYRPKYYKFFDSYETYFLPPLPAKYKKHD